YTLPLFSSILPRPPRSPLFPYTTLFRSLRPADLRRGEAKEPAIEPGARLAHGVDGYCVRRHAPGGLRADLAHQQRARGSRQDRLDRKSTRLNSSHRTISYAVFCLKKKNK